MKDEFWRAAVKSIRIGGTAVFLCASLLIGPRSVDAQNVTLARVISTAAGNGTNGSSGDGGPATSAELGLPGGIATDRWGNIYIADSVSDRIRVVNVQSSSITIAGVSIPAGDIATVAGNGTFGYSGDGGPATSAELDYPSDVALDGQGDIYIVDEQNAVVRVVNVQSSSITIAGVSIPSGDIATVAGDGEGCDGEADEWGDGCPATSASFANPYFVAVDKVGNIYITDTANNRVRVVNVQSSSITIAGVSIPAGDIATVTGGGSGCEGQADSVGDGCPAIDAEFSGPYGVAVDSAGNIYIADNGDARVRVVNVQSSSVTIAGVSIASGYIASIAGNGTAGFSGDGNPATSAELDGPFGLALDSAGDVYFGDEANYRIREVGTNGIITTIAGDGNASYSGDGGAATGGAFNPWGVALDGADNLYIGDYTNYRVRKVTAGGQAPVIFGQLNVGQTGTSQPVILSINSNLTVASSQVNGDFALTNASACNGAMTAGTFCTLQAQFSPTKPGQRWFQLSVTDSNSNQYTFGLEGVGVGSALAFTPGIISTLAGNGTTGYKGDGGPATSAELDYPNGVAVDSFGDIYIADSGNQRIRVVNVQSSSITIAGVTIPAGDIATVAGTGKAGYSGDGSAATSAELNSPEGVAVDSAGNLYIADYSNNRVRKVSTNGIITTVAGNGTAGYSGNGGPATSAELDDPVAVAVDSLDNVYVANDDDGRVEKVDINGIITTVAGYGSGCAGQTDSVGDGCPATSAVLVNPDGVAVDIAGNVYIADSGDYLVRKVGTNGIITAVAGNGTVGCSGNGGPTTSAEVEPNGVAVDSAGDVYIANFCSQISEVSTSGIITTVAGNGTYGYSGDGGPATNAKLSYTNGVAVDDAGNLYIADTQYNSRIRGVNVVTSALSFGPVAIDDYSSPQYVALSDVGNSALDFTSIVASTNFGTVGGDNPCSSSLAVGATCDVDVEFAPTTGGDPITGTLTVSDNAFNSLQTVSLSGNSTWLLSITASGTGNGTIAYGDDYDCNSTAGITSGTCSLTIDVGSSVTLYASAGDGSTFAGWGGACASFETTSPCTLTTVDTDSSVTATFNTAVVTNYTLTLNCGANMPLTCTELGTGTGDVTDNMGEIYCGESGGQPVVGEMTCSASYPAGTVVALTASPTSPSTFGGWTGACTGTGACSVTMNSNQAVTADFIPPPASVNLTFPVGTNSTVTGTFNCPSVPCAFGNSLQLTTDVSQSFTITLVATEVDPNGICLENSAGETAVQADFNCRFYEFFNYGTDLGTGGTIVPLCYGYANGNCVHYLVYYGTQGTEPPTSYYTGPVSWTITWNSTVTPGSYWLNSTPQMYDDPDVNEFSPPLPYGTNCSTPMMIETSTGPQQYSPMIYCQFDANITTYYDAVSGPVDPTEGGGSKEFNDVVVAFPPTMPGTDPLVTPPAETVPAISGACIVGCTVNGGIITFSEGVGATFLVTPTGYPAPSISESGNLPAGLTFNPATGILGGTPTAGTNASFPISFTATNTNGSATLNYTAAVDELTISTSTINFGTVYWGQLAVQLVTLTNNGTSPINISSVKITGPGNALGDYGEISFCPPLIKGMPGTLPPGKSCEIGVGILATAKIFSPTPSTGTMTITDSAAGSPQAILLIAQVINPQASVSPKSLSFSPQTHGSTSSPLPVTVNSTGNTPLSFSSVTVSNTNFKISSNGCTGSLSPPSTCVIEVEFTPGNKGKLTGTLKIVDNALSSPQSISLSGTGE